MILEQLQPASFKGFPFLTPRTQLTDGRKTATHEFVNSNNRFVEDLGAFSPKFTITAIVHGSDAIQQRDNFRGLLNDKGPGILVHPSYGRQEVTVEGQYTVSDVDTELGQFSFEITFARDSGATFPRQGQPTPSTVASSELTARTSILQRIEDQWITPITTVSNSDAANKLIDFATDVADAFVGIVDDASEIIRVTDEIKNNSFSLVRSGVDVTSSIRRTLESLDAIPTETLSVLFAVQSLLDFGSGDISIENPNGLSGDQFNRQINRDLFNSSIQSTNLVKAYTTSSLVDFQIVSRLDRNRALLSEASRLIISNIRSASSQFDAATARGVRVSTSRDRDSVNAILDTGSLAERVLSEKEENLYRLVSTKTVKTSARLLSYTLFADDAQTTIIADLNKNQKPSSLSGALEVINR